MSTRTVNLSIDFPRLSRSELFAILSKHEQLGRVLGVPMKTLVPSADANERDGVGSVRAIGLGPLRFEETITGFERDQTIAYRVSKGGFMKHHAAIMQFSARPSGGAHLEHTIEVESAIPGFTGILATVLGFVMRYAYQRLARR